MAQGYKAQPIPSTAGASRRLGATTRGDVAEESLLVSSSRTLLEPEQVAAILGVSCNTLNNWRVRKSGPRYMKAGNKLVRYPSDLLQEWIESQIRSTNDNANSQEEREVGVPLLGKRRRVQQGSRFGRHRTQQDRRQQGGSGSVQDGGGRQSSSSAPPGDTIQ